MATDLSSPRLIKPNNVTSLRSSIDEQITSSTENPFKQRHLSNGNYFKQWLPLSVSLPATLFPCPRTVTGFFFFFFCLLPFYSLPSPFCSTHLPFHFPSTNIIPTILFNFLFATYTYKRLKITTTASYQA